MTEWRKRIRDGLLGSAAATGTMSVDVELYYAAIVACLPASSKPAVVVTATMLQAEALELTGQTQEAGTVRLDSLGWARYGFGPDWAVRAKLNEISALRPARIQG